MVNSNAKGIYWMLISCVLNSMMIALVRQVSETFNPFQVVFLRNAFALLMFLPWLLSSSFGNMATTRVKSYLGRAVVGIIAMYFWFYSLKYVPLPLATALSFTSPLFTALFAVMFFKEKSSWHLWLSMLAGFIGVLIALRPGMEGFNHYALFAVFASFLWTFSGLLIKSLTATDSPQLISFYMVLMMTPLSFPAAAKFWQPIGMEHLPWLLALGLVSNLFQVTLSKAIAATDFVVILPFDFTRLIFISIIVYFAFGEVLDGPTLFGALIIMGAAIYAAYGQTKYKRKNSRKNPPTAEELRQEIT